MAYHGAHIAAAAAAEKRRQLEETEEEKMTNYNTGDLEKWEFKIVRSESGAFRKPQVLQALLEEEALAGWEMVEKFDNRRIRFRRPIEARKRDEMLPGYVDPYRTHYGASMTRVSILIALGLFILGVLVFVFFNLRSQSGGIGSGNPPMLLWLIGVGVISLAIAAIAATRRR
jgi:hypothetical protein